MKKSLASIAVAAALLSSPAFAELYVGAGPGITSPEDESSWKIYGGYRFTPMLAFEVGFNDLGQQSGVELESWSFAGVGTFPLNERWGVLAKVGANRPDTGIGDRDYELLLGVGIQYAISPRLGARLEYEDFGHYVYNVQGSEARDGNISLSLNYGF